MLWTIPTGLRGMPKGARRGRYSVAGRPFLDVRGRHMQKVQALRSRFRLRFQGFDHNRQRRVAPGVADGTLQRANPKGPTSINRDQGHASEGTLRNELSVRPHPTKNGLTGDRLRSV